MDREVRVRAGDCPCPGTPHSEEVITFVPELTLPMASGAFAAISNAPADLASMQAALIVGLLPATIEKWTFVDENHAEVEHTRANLERLLPWDKGGFEVANFADDLYSEALLKPFLVRTQKSSQASPTTLSTSQTPASSDQPPPPFRRSSRGGSAGIVSEVPGR